MAYEPRGIAVLSGSAGTEIFKVLDDSSLVLKAKTIGGVAAASGSILMVENTSTGNISSFDLAAENAAAHIGFTPVGTIEATNVQAAIAEAASEASSAANLVIGADSYESINLASQVLGLSGSTGLTVNAGSGKMTFNLDGEIGKLAGMLAADELAVITATERKGN